MIICIIVQDTKEVLEASSHVPRADDAVGVPGFKQGKGVGMHTGRDWDKQRTRGYNQ